MGPCSTINTSEVKPVRGNLQMGIIALETRAHDPENAGRETEQVNVQFLSSVGSSLDETIDIPMATGGGGGQASLILYASSLN